MFLLRSFLCLLQLVLAVQLNLGSRNQLFLARGRECGEVVMEWAIKRGRKTEVHEDGWVG